MRITKLALAAGIAVSLAACNSDNSYSSIPNLDDDKVLPTIKCGDDISKTINSTETGVIVDYDKPIGRDNIYGATTAQIAGLEAGETFPIGTTTNTFEVTDEAGNTASCSFDVIVSVYEISDDKPLFIDTNPTPNNKTWQKVAVMSDEFNDGVFDEQKWANTDPRRWIGRAPGLFKADTVSEAGGNLKLTAYQLTETEVVNGQTFTHAGSNIYSRTPSEVGVYVEARMKANKTFMSSTFWLINNRSDGQGCDVRVTELDIQETVGEVTSTASFAQSFDETMHSNTHARQGVCEETPSGSRGNNTYLGGKSWQDYHVYGAWWKSASEVEFYVDGRHVYTVNPAAPFDLPMYLRMVVETYDWNPAPADGGMTGSEEERTTYYDWVRTWTLVDK